MDNPVVVTAPEVKRPLPIRAVGKAVRLVRGAVWRWRLAAFGSGSSIEWPSYVSGGKSISVGRNVEIWRGARIDALRPAKAVVRVSIGDGSAIHPGVHIGAAELVSIGSGALIAAGAYITDHDHDFSDPTAPAISHRRLLVGPVRIGNFVWIGERAMVLKGVTIGHYSVVGAGSIVTRDVPPYSIAVGSPARVVKHYDPASRSWVRAEAS